MHYLPATGMINLNFPPRMNFGIERCPPRQEAVKRVQSRVTFPANTSLVATESARSDAHGVGSLLHRLISLVSVTLPEAIVELEHGLWMATVLSKRDFPLL